MKDKRILILDDDYDVRFNLTLYLEDEGFNCMAFEKGEDALGFLAKDEVDLAIVDIRLPGINGEEFIVSSNKLNKDLKYIIHTGSAEYVVSSEIEMLGLSQKDVFHKPVSEMNEFVKKIQLALQKE